MDKEFETLMSQAIKLQMLKEFVSNKPDHFTKDSEDLAEIISKWDLAWRVVFGEDSDELNYILDTSKDAMKAAYTMGMLEAVDKVLEIQRDIFEEFRQEYGNKKH